MNSYIVLHWRSFNIDENGQIVSIDLKLPHYRDRAAHRPTSLAVADSSRLAGRLAPRAAAAVADQPETFPTPMEEPRKVMKAWYLGSLQVRLNDYFFLVLAFLAAFLC
jgi:hypothetical protein